MQVRINTYRCTFQIQLDGTLQQTERQLTEEGELTDYELDELQTVAIDISKSQTILIEKERENGIKKDYDEFSLDLKFIE